MSIEPISENLIIMIMVIMMMMIKFRKNRDFQGIALSLLKPQ